MATSYLHIKVGLELTKDEIRYLGSIPGFSDLVGTPAKHMELNLDKARTLFDCMQNDPFGCEPDLENPYNRELREAIWTGLNKSMQVIATAHNVRCRDI